MINPINLLSTNKIGIVKNFNFQKPPINVGLAADVFERSSVSNVSFTSVDSSKRGNALRELAGVPCPYCGIPIIGGKEVSHITKEAMSVDSKKALSLLRPFENRMQPVEKQVFNLMEDLSTKNPQKTLRQLLDKVRPDHLEAIKQQEYDILNRIDEVSSIVENKEQSKALHELINRSKGIIDKQDENYIFRRTRFMEHLEEITSKMNEPEIVEELNKIAEELPKATDSVSAFIVKFSQKDPKTKMEKTSYQIARALIDPSIGSIEHVKPAIPQNKSEKCGKDSVSNYIYASRKYNCGRKNLPLTEWIKKNPDIPKHMQSYIDAVIDKINNGAMKEYKAYPIVVAKTLELESNGAIKLDTSKLKLTKKEMKAAIKKCEEAVDSPRSTAAAKKLRLIA